jgi:alkylhydroperoxidase/carboxymuconolactone decarboxylase family protein YurZ
MTVGASPGGDEMVHPMRTMTPLGPPPRIIPKDGVPHRVKMTMTPERLDTLRRLALNEQVTTSRVMGGDMAASSSLDARSAALIGLVALLSVDSDAAAFRWAIDVGLAAGLDDDDVFDALLVVAPIIGTARLTSVLPHLMEALDLDVFDE